MRICFVGDSFVNGTGDPDCLGWAGRLCAIACRAGHDVTYYNLGVRRETSADIRSRWQQEVTCRLPSEYDGRIVFSFGVNDTTVEAGQVRVAEPDSIKNARQILAEASRSHLVLMVGPPPIADVEQNFRSARLSHQFLALCQSLNVPYLEVMPALQASDLWMREVAENDGAHPRAAGYTLLAELIAQWEAWQSWFKSE